MGGCSKGCKMGPAQAAPVYTRSLVLYRGGNSSSRDTPAIKHRQGVIEQNLPSSSEFPRHLDTRC
jgi:hypothetical protein